MANRVAGQENKPKVSLKMRAILLALQILLPFALYFFMQSGCAAGAYVVAGLIALSMAVLIWQK
jgi:hypothetical protein